MRNASGVLHRKFQNAVGPIHAYVDTLASLLVWRVWGSSWRPSPFQAACLQNPNPADEAKKYCKPLKVRFPVPRSCLRFLLARGPQNNRWFVLRLPVRTAPPVPDTSYCAFRAVRTSIRTYLHTYVLTGGSVLDMLASTPPPGRPSPQLGDKLSRAAAPLRRPPKPTSRPRVPELPPAARRGAVSARSPRRKSQLARGCAPRHGAAVRPLCIEPARARHRPP